MKELLKIRIFVRWQGVGAHRSGVYTLVQEHLSMTATLPASQKDNIKECFYE